MIAGWLRTAAAELRAGMSLRSALAAASRSYPALELEHPSRLAAAGRPMTEVGAAMASVRGMEAAAVVLEVTSFTGGSVAPVLEALAVEAADEAGLAAERRSLTVAARWSIGLVGGFPLLILVVQIARVRSPGCSRLASSQRHWCSPGCCSSSRGWQRLRF